MADTKISALTSGGDLLATDAIPVARAGANRRAVLPLDTDGTLAANSDAKIATQKATKTYIGSRITANAVSLIANQNGILTTNTAAQNATALQALIDAYTPTAANIYFTEPVPLDPITLKSNVKLLGNNFSARKGSVSGTSTPTGAAFLITNTSTPLVIVQTNTAIDGIIFYYPSQSYSATTIAGTTTYPPTIQRTTGQVGSFSCTNCAFIGNTSCIDFDTNASSSNWSEDILIDLCYSYPLGGYFFKGTWILDIPRITRCHVNPGVGDAFLGHLPYTNGLIGDITTNGAGSSGTGGVFWLTSSDEFMMSENFAFGVNTGFHINDSYGVLVNCNADQVETACHVTLTSTLSYKYVELLGFSGILGGGTLTSRNVVLFDGSGGKLFAHGLHGITSTSGVVPPSSTPGGNSLIKVSGTGSQLVSIYGCRTSAVTGAFAKFVDKTNGSSTVYWLDSDQGGVTSASAASAYPAIFAPSINKLTLTQPATGATLTITDGKTLSASNTLTLAGTDSTTQTFPEISANVGFREVPGNSKSTAYTTILSDSGKSIDHPASDANARTFTIDSNANVAYPIGTCITFTNMASQNVTIAITSDTMYLAGTGTTGSRTLAQYGIATARKLTSTTWLISGSGLT